jgi:hypothetical protein
LFDAAIVVGAWSTERRFAEYSPWHNASRYARFLIEELMPRVNTEFRTLTGPEHTSAIQMGLSVRLADVQRARLVEADDGIEHRVFSVFIRGAAAG